MEDREILEEYIQDCESKFLMGSEVTGTELYEPIKNLLKENENLKQAILINKREYQDVCNENKELEDKVEEYRIGWCNKAEELEAKRKEYQETYKDVREELKELKRENKSKQKAYDNCYCEYKHYKQFESIPTSLVKEKIEELKHKDFMAIQVCSQHDNKALAQIEILNSLLGEE